RSIQRWAAVASAWATLTCAPVAQGPGQAVAHALHFPAVFPNGQATRGRVPGPPMDHIVLVTSDGVRWKDVFEAGDQLPNLTRLRSRDGVAIGVPGSGSEMQASGPAF